MLQQGCQQKQLEMELLPETTKDLDIIDVMTLRERDIDWLITLNASGRTSAMTIQIMHPAAKPVQKGRTLLNVSAQRKDGTATMG